MDRLTRIGVIILLLAGCTSEPANQSAVQEANFSSTEHMLLQTDNHSKLIALYKEELAKSGRTEIRMKLINQYLLAMDYESASFQLANLSEYEAKNHEALFYKAKVDFYEGKYSLAENNCLASLIAKPEQPHVHNLLGLVYAQSSNTTDARKQFNLARLYYHDDIIVKNNLAMIDIIEGDYKTAVERLTPLYVSEQADQQVIANLAMAHANLGQFEHVKILLEDNYSIEQISLIYHGLRTMTPVAPFTPELNGGAI
ncbi:tetratricopeptide repeat protein [Vibrio tapetis]|uniref:Putative secretion system protein n=1 Tax=Vibrio tapetis subsp. tapetis TaxID=1671868 RepID=A0A2N8ZC71_9VIBR|nr:hypothetical protein [Vibrio tapetis]SON49506.1 putative secretion system protein [Vibrio tapetis subsp. tapetis]